MLQKALIQIVFRRQIKVMPTDSFPFNKSFDFCKVTFVLALAYLQQLLVDDVNAALLRMLKIMHKDFDLSL